MTDVVTQPSQVPFWQRCIEWLNRKRRETAIGLFIAAAVSAALPIWLGVKLGRDYLALTILDAFLPVLLGLLGLGHMMGAEVGPPDLKEADRTRTLVLVGGGLVGLLAVVNAVVLCFLVFVSEGPDKESWWNAFFAKGFDVWRKEWWRLALVLGCLLGGLAIMLASLSLGSGEVRTSSFMRRLLYGYNAALCGLLLLAILVLVNVFSYVRLGPFKWFGETSDWTSSNIYTISESTRNTLTGLNKPVMIYAMQSGDSFGDAEMRTLIENCRAVTNKIDVEYLSYDRNKTRVAELHNKYGVIEGPGLLIVYGPEGNQLSDFIPLTDMFRRMRDDRTGETRGFEFEGENLFTDKLVHLQGGKAKTKIYFTQGNGEPDLNVFPSPREQSPGLGILRTRLADASNQVLPLPLDENTKEVPTDAGLVVVAGPTRPLPEQAVTALTGYMNPPGERDPRKKGRMIVLLKVVPNRDGSMVQTGLEKLLGDFRVQVPNERILALPMNPQPYPYEPRVVPLMPSPGSRHPVARSFIKKDEGSLNFLTLFVDARAVQPAEEGFGTSRGDYRVEPLFAAGFSGSPKFLFSEPDLRSSAIAIVNKVRSNFASPQVQARLRNNIPVAVAVSEANPEVGAKEDTPRLVVFGDADWVSNDGLDERLEGFENYDMFRSCVSWLRERPDTGEKAQSKSRKIYALEPSDGVGRLRWLPAVLFLVAIVGLGGGIWLVRRR